MHPVYELLAKCAKNRNQPLPPIPAEVEACRRETVEDTVEALDAGGLLPPPTHPPRTFYHSAETPDVILRGALFDVPGRPGYFESRASVRSGFLMSPEPKPWEVAFVESPRTAPAVLTDDNWVGVRLRMVIPEGKAPADTRKLVCRDGKLRAALPAGGYPLPETIEHALWYAAARERIVTAEAIFRELRAYMGFREQTPEWQFLPHVPNRPDPYGVGAETWTRFLRRYMRGTADTFGLNDFLRERVPFRPLIAPNLVSVQPMTAPVGAIFYTDYLRRGEPGAEPVGFTEETKLAMGEEAGDREARKAVSFGSRYGSSANDLRESLAYVLQGIGGRPNTEDVRGDVFDLVSEGVSRSLGVPEKYLRREPPREPPQPPKSRKGLLKGVSMVASMVRSGNVDLLLATDPQELGDDLLEALRRLADLFNTGVYDVSLILSRLTLQGPAVTS